MIHFFQLLKITIQFLPKAKKQSTWSSHIYIIKTSLDRYFNIPIFFLLQFNPNHRFKSRTKSQTRWPGSSRQLESNGLDFPFPIPRSRPRYFLHSRSLHGQKTRATRAALRSRWPLTTDSSWLSFSEFLPSSDWSGRFIRGGCPIAGAPPPPRFPISNEIVGRPNKKSFSFLSSDPPPLIPSNFLRPIFFLLLLSTFVPFKHVYNMYKQLSLLKSSE